MKRKRIAGCDFWCDDRRQYVWHAVLYSEEESEKASQILIRCQMCADCFFCSFCISCQSCKNCKRCIGLIKTCGAEDVHRRQKTEAYGNASVSFCRLNMFGRSGSLCWEIDFGCIICIRC